MAKKKAEGNPKLESLQEQYKEETGKNEFTAVN